MKSCIVAIENDVNFLGRLRARFQENGLTARFDLRAVEVRAGTVAEAVSYCRQAVASIARGGHPIECIMTDVVIIEKEEGPSDTSGLDIAAALAVDYPGVPILAMTRYNRHHRFIARISVAACIDGVVPKPYLESDECSSTDMIALVSKARDRARLRSAAAGADSVPAGKVCVEESIDLAIVCALNTPEFEEVRKLSSWHRLETPADATAYWVTKWTSRSGRVLNVVAATQQAMGVTSCAILATKLIARFVPRYVVQVGIAAGITGNPGDIYFASSVFDYASGKVTEKKGGGFVFDPSGDSLPADATVLQWAREAEADGSLLLSIQKKFPGGRFEQKLPGLHIGPFATGPLVVSSRTFVKNIRARQRKVIALDMESYAVFRAAAEWGSDRCRAMAIKASSDSGVDKSDEAQGRAAFFAAQFLYEFSMEYLGRE